MIPTDGPLDTVPDAEQPALVVASSSSAVPATAEGRDALARRALGSVVGLRDAAVERVETPAQTGGVSYVAEATAKTPAPAAAVTWCRRRASCPAACRTPSASPAPRIGRDRAALAPRPRAVAVSVEPRG